MWATLAQLVERLIRNQQVAGSIPAGGSPRWTSENRPYVDTSKPANGAEPEQEYLYRAGGGLASIFFDKTSPARFILAKPGRRIRQRRDATGAPTQRPEWLGRRKPPRQPHHSGAKAINPRGLGTESPTRMNISDIRILSAGAIDSRCSCLASDCKHSVRLQGSP